VRSHRATDSFAGTPLPRATFRFASAPHAGQYREIDQGPFLTHPIEAGQLLARDGQPATRRYGRAV